MSIQRSALGRENSAMVQYSGLDSALGRRHDLLKDALSGRGKMVVLERGAQSATDLMCLRWLYPGGVMPVVCFPSTQTHLVYCVEVAASLGVPVFAVIDETSVYEALLGESRPVVLAFPPNPRRKPPSRAPKTEGPEALDKWIRAQAEDLALFELDAGSADKNDWLVISYGACAAPAREAVQQARAKDLTVQHLTLQTIFPLPERKIAALAMGKRFIVVPENNAGQLHGEIQRIVPSLPVVAVTGLESPVTADDVLAALMKFPRCC